jgi:hypothetical protein
MGMLLQEESPLMDHQADIVGPIFSNRCQEQTLVCQGRHTDEVEQKGEHPKMVKMHETIS